MQHRKFNMTRIMYFICMFLFILIFIQNICAKTLIACEISDTNDNFVQIWDQTNKYYDNDNYEDSISYILDNIDHVNNIDNKLCLYFTLAGSYYGLNEYDKALRYYKEIYATNSNHQFAVKSLFMSGIIYEMLNKYDVAEQMYIKITKEYPDTMAAKNINVSYEMNGSYLQLDEDVFFKNKIQKIYVQLMDKVIDHIQVDGIIALTGIVVSLFFSIALILVVAVGYILKAYKPDNLLDILKIIVIFCVANTISAIVTLNDTGASGQYISPSSIITIVFIILLFQNKLSTMSFSVKNLDWKSVVKYSLLMICILAFFATLNMLGLFEVDNNLSQPLEKLIKANNGGILGVISISILLFCVIVVEEVFYRGIIYGALSNKSKTFGILGASFLYAFCYYMSGAPFLIRFLFGIVLTMLYVRTNTIITPIILKSALMLIVVFYSF